MFSAALFCLVVAISDGDTLKVRCGEPGAFHQLTVRLHAIDAPELNQPFGRRAKQALSRIAWRKEARLDCGEDDRYHRRVCRVRVAPEGCAQARCPKTLDAGLRMLSLGLAWWARGYADEQPPDERGQYAFAESEAKGRRAGLWADRDPMPPWRWRAGHPRPR